MAGLHFNIAMSPRFEKLAGSNRAEPIQIVVTDNDGEVTTPDDEVAIRIFDNTGADLNGNLYEDDALTTPLLVSATFGAAYAEVPTGAYIGHYNCYYKLLPSAVVESLSVSVLALSVGNLVAAAFVVSVANNPAVDVLAALVDGTLSVSNALKQIRSVVAGKAAKVGDAHKFYDNAGAVITKTLTISNDDRIST